MNIIIDEESEEKMNKMSNPQPFRICRTPRFTLARSAATLLFVLVALLLGLVPPRASQAVDVPSPQAPPPANDNFANAQSISGSTVSVDGTTEGATLEGGEPAPDPASADPWPGEHTVWYRWTAPTSGSTTIDTCRANIDSILSVYTNLELGLYYDRVVDNNDDHAYCGNDTLGSKVTFEAQAGTTYHISVGDTGALQQSTFTLKLSAPRDTQAPRVTSTSPTAKATGVAPGANLTATFSEKMDPASITKSTFKLFRVTSNGTTQITNVSVSPSTDRLRATLDPFGSSTRLLSKGTKYKAVVTTGAKDVADNQLDQDQDPSNGLQQMGWSFTVRN